ncbi:hypothetical protein F5Y19DRAFT_342209 [Xylariaceae sp. FL1651]|nr:hypothetical protein F5Y19DRAFT_342209 [Xylariaceae sp. FL1651]
MHMLRLSLLALQTSALGVHATTHAPVVSKGVVVDDNDLNQQISDLAHQALEQAKQSIGGPESAVSTRSTSCNLKTLRVRREWGALSKCERTDYIKAVKCLQSRPANTPSSVAPGAKTRFDDFVATHINQTLAIHYTGNFLVWHRYFTWLYEEALREECGYLGTQPYWDWAKTAATGMHASPIFDGSDTSMSGDGEPIANQSKVVLTGINLPPLYLDPGTGGGCVVSGPFKDLVVNLGPAALAVPGGSQQANPNGPLAYNPRCLKRSLTDTINKEFANATAVLSLLVGTDNVYDFEMQMQGIPEDASIGVHGGGHYALGGDPGRDVFVSPGDPAFYLHHGMIDRTWWIWQNLKPSERFSGPKALIGTNTFLNNPPSANTTYDDFVQYGFAAGPPRQIKELMSTVAGPFCYVYE